MHNVLVVSTFAYALVTDTSDALTLTVHVSTFVANKIEYYCFMSNHMNRRYNELAKEGDLRKTKENVGLSPAKDISTRLQSCLTDSFDRSATNQAAYGTSMDSGEPDVAHYPDRF